MPVVPATLEPFAAWRPHAATPSSIVAVLLGCASLLPAQSGTHTAPPGIHVPATADQQGQPMVSDAGVDDKVHLRAHRVSLPLVLVRGYPFFEGEVNGVHGKLLFDLGEPSSFVLDVRRIEPPNGRKAGRGYFASGGSFDTYRFPLVNELKLAHGPAFHAIPDVRGVPGLPIETRVTPDFLGWIGLHFFAGYVARLDYGRPSVSFYANDAAGSGMRAALRHERVEQIIHLDGTPDAGTRTFPVQIGSVRLEATFDTGSHDTVWLTTEALRQMAAEGTLHAGPGQTVTLESISIDGHPYVLHSAVEVAAGKAPFVAGRGQPGGNTLVLGYEFLREHRTVWDYGHGAVLLLAD